MGGTVAAQGRLDGPWLVDVLRAGIHAVFARQEHLNRINVFPVPDGDTGTNMAMTLHAVLLAIDREPAAHAGSLLTRIADAAIDGARGNSGAILAQFLLGLGDRAGHLAELSPGDFAAACSSGATYARDAVTEPREGTLLSVLTAFALEMERLARETAVTDFDALFAQGLARARVSLAATPQQLDVLREAGVVDAGAQGFVDMLEGMSRFLDTGELTAAAPPQEPATEPAIVGGGDAAHRFCAECVLTAASADQRRLREQFSVLGSSLVIAGTRRKLRIHLHTNEPEKLFRLAASFGSVSAQKADDMLQQRAAAHHARGKRVAVVTDSAADIPEDALERLELHVVPARVHFGTRSFLDKVSLSQEEFYAELARSPEHPKTSQPPPGDFRRMYEFLCSHYESVVSISIAASVSGTYNAARAAATRMPPGRVSVIDTGNASLGQGLVAMYAAECALAGFAGDEVVAAAREAAARTKTFALLGRLDYAVRGGRVPRFVKTAADWLRFSPVLTNLPGGRIGPGGVIFGRRALRSRFAAYVQRRVRPGVRHRLAVAHANAEGEGRALLDELARLLPDVESAWLTTCGTALGVHGGPGMLVVAVQEYTAPRPPVSA
ncbi:MAG TPA: DegV family protein [Steroidobacteraceae bacterium]|nr:DegV family protein [Steroidobacteraceae bacterium]